LESLTASAVASAKDRRKASGLALIPFPAAPSSHGEAFSNELYEAVLALSRVLHAELNWTLVSAQLDLSAEL
jgi:hypothetical protein